VYRDGRVHVLTEKCPTCVFHPGNRMDLQPGRLADLVRRNVAAGAGLTCHATLMSAEQPRAICRGFWDSYRHQVPLLQAAERLGIVTEQPVPS
jgi:hypothetical protein